MNYQWSMILIVLAVVQIHASRSVRQATTFNCPATLCQFVNCGNGQCVLNNTIADCFSCVCDAGYTGRVCDTQITSPSACNPPCQNGAQCQQTSANTAVCICPAGYTGSQCETSILATHICVTNPAAVCFNGGTCAINGTGFVCNCPTGWNGTNCETARALTTCTPNVCGPHGTCTDVILPNGGITVFCVCEASWTGTFCDSNLSITCPSNFCQNGGQCQMNGATPYCNCPSTHTGRQCETAISSVSSTTPTSVTPTGGCSSNPCLNGAACYNTGNGFYCSCPSTHTGRQCETAISSTTPASVTPTGDCSSKPCLNGGSCYKTGNSFVCLCQPLYSGPACALQNSMTSPNPSTSSNINACLSNPCNNGGSCYKYGNSFVCVCTTQYTGATCDALKTTGMPSVTTPNTAVTCDNQPCQNGATCYNTGNSYFCYCGSNSNFTGKNCDTPKVTSDSTCPLDCSPGYCIRTGASQNAYACMCNGALTPSSCSS